MTDLIRISSEKNNKFRLKIKPCFHSATREAISYENKKQINKTKHYKRYKKKRGTSNNSRLFLPPSPSPPLPYPPQATPSTLVRCFFPFEKNTFFVIELFNNIMQFFSQVFLCVYCHSHKFLPPRQGEDSYVRLHLIKLRRSRHSLIWNTLGLLEIFTNLFCLNNRFQVISTLLTLYQMQSCFLSAQTF